MIICYTLYECTNKFEALNTLILKTDIERMNFLIMLQSYRNIDEYICIYIYIVVFIVIKKRMCMRTLERLKVNLYLHSFGKR